MDNKYKWDIAASMPEQFAQSIRCALYVALLFFAAGSCLGDDPEEGIYFQKALKEADSHQFDAALFDYSKVIDLDPANEPACVNRGNIEMHQGNLDGALADYNKAIELEPTDVSVWFDRGNLKIRNKDMAGALVDLNKAIELGPALAGPYDSRGVVKQSQGDLAGALADFNKAIVLTPDSSIPYNHRGALDQQQGNLDSALADLDRAIKLDPTLASAYLSRGMVKEGQDDLVGAVADYSKATILGSDPSAYNDRGALEARQGNLDAALADYDQAIKLDPKRGVFYSNRASVKLAKGDRDGAHDDLKRSEEFKSDLTAGAYRDRGHMEAAMHQWDNSLADLNRAVKLDPKDADIIVDLGRYKASRGDIPGAVEDFNQAISLNPNDAAAYYQRGVAEGKNDDSEGAFADFNKAIGLDPQHAEFYGGRAAAERELGDDKAAMDDDNKAITIAPDYALAYRLRGFLRYNQRNFDGALADFVKFCVLDSRDPQDFIRFRIWIIRAREGHEAEATAELQAYLQDRKSGGTNDWPLKVAHYLTGTLSEPDLLSAAQDRNPKRNDAHHAEAWFFVASRHLAEGNEERAKNCFARCLATNAKGIEDYKSAVAELKYLEQQDRSSVSRVSSPP